MHLIPRDEHGGLGTGADIGFDEPLYTVEASGDAEYDTPTIRLGYGSMLTPDSVYDYDLATGELILLKRTPVLPDPTFGPYDPDRYVQERGWARAADGTEVPLSIVRRADVALDGSAPAVLYGYGSYELPDGSELLHRPALLAGPGHRVRDRARPRRRRAGAQLVRAGQDAEQDQHLHRLRRLRRLPGRARLHRPPTGWRPAAAVPAGC